MKTFKKIYFPLLFALLFVGCENSLDLEPRDKLTADEIFATPASTNLYLADLYNRLPIEDLTFFPNQGFNYNAANPNNNGICAEMFTGIATHSNVNAPGFINGDKFKWWSDAYSLIRDINLFMEIVPTLNITQQQKDLYLGEASFLRAGIMYLAYEQGGG